MEQLAVEAQVVLLGVPLSRITEAEPPLPATKLAPCTAIGKLSTAPARTLDGSSVSMTGPVVSATAGTDTDPEEFAWLVATTVIALGDGAKVGAE